MIIEGSLARTDATAILQPTSPTAGRLLTAANEMMIERRGIDVSLSDIAQRAGVSAALVKYHFGNKDNLLVSLLARNAASEVKALRHLLDQPIPARRKLELHISGIIKSYYLFPYMNRLLHYLTDESRPEIAAKVSLFFVKPLLDFHREVLNQGVREGDFRPVDPVLFYTTLIGACDYLFYLRHMMIQAADVGPIDTAVCRQYAEHVQTFVFAGLAAGTRPDAS